MTDNIIDIFNNNIMLLEKTDKAICYFREQQHDIALRIIVDSIELIRHTLEAVIINKDYFRLVEIDSVTEMLGGILDAYKMGDYILLADLLELQLLSFIIGVQELIISKELVTFSEETYHKNLATLKNNSSGLENLSVETIDPQLLLKEGYRVEFSSSGLMTLAAKNDDSSFYFHTNSRISYEAFALSRAWYNKKVKRYIIYGLAFGYHINELLSLSGDSEIIIYEEDLNVILLACAFTDLKKIFMAGKVRLVYDPSFLELKKAIANLQRNEVFYVHYPSFLNIRNEEGRKLLVNHVSWIRPD